jgi:hypothetical protein
MTSAVFMCYPLCGNIGSNRDECKAQSCEGVRAVRRRAASGGRGQRRIAQAGQGAPEFGQGAAAGRGQQRGEGARVGLHQLGADLAPCRMLGAFDREHGRGHRRGVGRGLRHRGAHPFDRVKGRMLVGIVGQDTPQGCKAHLPDAGHLPEPDRVHPAA